MVQTYNFFPRKGLPRLPSGFQLCLENVNNRRLDGWQDRPATDSEVGGEDDRVGHRGAEGSGDSHAVGGLAFDFGLGLDGDGGGEKHGLEG